MSTRRTFIQQSALAGIVAGIPGQFSFLMNDDKDFSYESLYLKLQLLRDKPQFSFFSTDSLGGKQFSVNPLLKNLEYAEEQYESKVTSKSIAYFLKTKRKHNPAWECKMRDKSFTIQTRWNSELKVSPFEIIFSQRINHCTVLGNLCGDKQIDFPCVFAFTGYGYFSYIL